jgi:hypothetical protein
VLHTEIGPNHNDTRNWMALCFDHEALIKIIFFVKVCESMDKAFYYFCKLKNISIMNRDIAAQTSAKIIKIIKSYFTEKALTWSKKV